MLPGYSLEISNRITRDVPGTVLRLSARKQTYSDLKTSEEGQASHVTTTAQVQALPQNYTDMSGNNRLRWQLVMETGIYVCLFARLF
jgi:hypothetical protein